ncbi:class I alpha-mannosidase 1A [Aspergillus glaucus CBS 516.65]|uniref:alpha-1,2-Mannosidase n=1 Tax=Aspergillus glaucus CBS 516.65 TaxID=1160497 RepID=A0A1L9VGB0_ASPGL|nr:hypothetical protein ASPGLDRAFT_129706 [Aspergillus glaucus CBS 516.65]OJJ82862.1 hypothetical protein ASPGLDRAFT_129706 [Aspergillus glaucus CBS 516.65]
MFPVNQPPPHWKKVPELFPLAPEEQIKLPTGEPKSLPKLQASFEVESVEEKEKRLEKLDEIRKTFEYAWNGYKSSAMGKDELKPLRGGYKDTFNGWGATVVDALDTLWVMGLEEEFALAVEHVKSIDFTTSERPEIPVFETVIRYMGGLLGAYDISGKKYPVLLEKAVQLAEIVMGAFDTPNRMPTLFYKWTPDQASRVHHASRRAVLAEIGSLSMEFTRLAQLTKDDKYYDAITRITNELERVQSSSKLPGLWPTKLDATGCEKPIPSPAVVRDIPSPSNSSSSPVSTPSARPVPTDIESYKNYFKRRDESGLAQDAQPANYEQLIKEKNPEAHIVPADSDCKGALITQNSYKDAFGLGAEADSTYEYLPKEYMLLGGLNDQYKSMYEKAMDAAREHLLFQPMVKHGRDIRFLATLDLRKPLSELQPNRVPTRYEATHLTCYAGGMFAVGSKLFGIDGDMDIAAKLTDGCVWAYESTYTGIMPETFLVVPCKKGEPCTWDEIRYKDALDPWREERLVAMQKMKEQVTEVRESQEDARDASQTAETPVPTTPKVKATRRSLLSSLPGDPAAALADDYVKARIREERLPPGIVRMTDRRYLLRPEAIESVFIMYRLTGDNYWREKGWRMFEGIAKHTRTNFAHSAIEDVTSMQPEFQDSMESFWLSETLKYFYLLFSDPSVVSLDEYVL